MERSKVSIAIVGGGIAGLATAYYLEQAAREEGWGLTGVLLEQERRLGGKLLTLDEEGFLVEGGPDSFLTQKPSGLQMIRELGMEGDLLYPQVHGVFLLHNRLLHPVPSGLLGVVPTEPSALWKASFLSWRGKIRASLEPLVRRRISREDESLGAFLRRRLGTEMAQRLVEPLTAGIHAGDPEQLSLRALFPTLAEWEERYGSLARALHAARPGPRGTPSKGPFASLRRGMASLPHGVGTALRRFTILSGTTVAEIASVPEGDRSSFRLSLKGGDSLVAECVVLAIPAPNAASLLRPIAPRASTVLSQMTFASTASVTLAFRREAVAHPLNGSGFLVPRAEQSPLTASTWSSAKWPERAPQGWALLRAFLGWAKDDSLVHQDDPTLIRVATEALRPLLGLRGESKRAWVQRWPQALPQYRVGHLAWLDKVDEAMSDCPGLFLVGASYRGVGVPDCIRQGKETAQRIRDVFLSRSRGLGEALSAPGRRTDTLKRT